MLWIWIQLNFKWKLKTKNTILNQLFSNNNNFFTITVTCCDKISINYYPFLIKYMIRTVTKIVAKSIIKMNQLISLNKASNHTLSVYVKITLLVCYPNQISSYIWTLKNKFLLLINLFLQIKFPNQFLSKVPLLKTSLTSIWNHAMRIWSLHCPNWEKIIPFKTKNLSYLDQFQIIRMRTILQTTRNHIQNRRWNLMQKTEKVKMNSLKPKNVFLPSLGITILKILNRSISTD